MASKLGDYDKDRKKTQTPLPICAYASLTNQEMENEKSGEGDKNLHSFVLYCTEKQCVEFAYLKVGITKTSTSFQSSSQAEVTNARGEVSFQKDISRFEVTMSYTGFGILCGSARQLSVKIAETTSHSHGNPQHLTPGELIAVNVVVDRTVGKIIRH